MCVCVCETVFKPEFDQLSFVAAQPNAKHVYQRSCHTEV